MVMMPSELLIEIQKLREKIKKAELPAGLLEKTAEMVARLNRITKFAGYSTEYERTSRYLDWVTSLPWHQRTEDLLDLEKAKAVLDKSHYGLEEIKERILEHLAVLNLRRQRSVDKDRPSALRAPILCLVGLVGTGKTSLGAAIAEAMGRKFIRIPFGGMGSALELRGQSRLHLESEPGQVIKALRRCGSKNPVLLLDEIDRVAEETRSDIMGVLIELLDSEQNLAFSDYFVDYPFDLSEVLFLATANNTTNISAPVLDRLEPLSMPSYSDKEKIIIGRDYVLPQVLAETGLTKADLKINDAVWPQIVRPLGYDAGIRTLERTIQGICRKAAKMIVQKKDQEFQITTANIKEYLSQW